MVIDTVNCITITMYLFANTNYRIDLKSLFRGAKLFWLYIASKTQDKSQARIKPEILSNLSPTPTRKVWPNLHLWVRVFSLTKCYNKKN